MFYEFEIKIMNHISRTEFNISESNNLSYVYTALYFGENNLMIELLVWKLSR